MKSFRRYIIEIFGEPSDSNFTHEGHNYDLNGLLSATIGMEPTQVPVSQLKWIMKYDPMSQEDAERILSADLAAPLLITKEPQEGNKFVVLDGIHRLAKAIQQHVLELPCVEVTEELLDRYRIQS
jgi:hypothetical protein